jgi:zinc protease
MALRATTTHEKERLTPRPLSPHGFSGETNPPKNSVGRGQGGVGPFHGRHKLNPKDTKSTKRHGGISRQDRISLSGSGLCLFALFVSLGFNLCFVARVPAAELSLPFEKHRLANGLTVILHRDVSTPRVAVNLWYGVGSADEQPGRTGFAHLFEHLMFTGSKHAPEGLFDRLMAAEGGTNNASTAEDRTNYHEEGPSHLLPVFLWLEADRMASLGETLGPVALDRQREVVRNERRESYENRPYGAAELRIPALMYPPGHPYSWPIIGAHADLVAASLTDVRAFFRRHYVPTNASLAIAGDFEPAEARRLVERYFGWVPAGESAPRPQAAPLAPMRARRLTLRDRAALPRVTMVWRSPPYFAPGDAECDLLASILGRGKSSRLYRALVRRGKAQDVSADQGSRRLGSLFTIEATASLGRSPAELERAIDGELARLRAAGPTAEEVARARNAIEADFVRGIESLDDRADLLNTYQFYRGDPGAIAWDRARYRRATADTVRRAARAFQPTNRLTVVVLPGGSRPAAAGERPDARARIVMLNSVNPLAPLERPAPPSIPEPGWMAQPPAIGRPRPVRLPAEHRFRLPNGMAVALVERRTLPLVAARLVLRGGAEEEPAGQTGLAELVASMLDEGAGRRSSEQIALELDRNAIRLDAAAGRENSHVGINSLARAFPRAIDLLADIVIRPRFDAIEFRRVRREHLATLETRRTEPEEVASLVFRRALYGDLSPLGRPVDGYPATVRRLRPSDLRRFHDRHYRPDRAALIVAGDITVAELRPMVMRAFGTWRPQRTATAPRTAHPAPRTSHAPKAPRLVLVPFPGAPQSVLRIGHPGPSRRSPEYAALEALNQVVGGSFTSRLNQNLRERNGYTYGAWSSFGWSRGPGPFVAGAAVFRDVTAKALQECLGELTRLPTSPIAAEELRQAVALAREERVRALAQVDHLVDLYAEPAEFGIPEDDLARVLARLEELTTTDLKRAARMIDTGRATIVIVGDVARLRPSLTALGLGTPQLRDADGNLLPAK